MYLICTLYYPFGFPFLFHALRVEGIHVYFNCRYVYHNSTSARAEVSLMTVCYKKVTYGRRVEIMRTLDPWPLSIDKQSSPSHE